MAGSFLPLLPDTSWPLAPWAIPWQLMVSNPSTLPAILLTSTEDCDTFLSTDAGLTWTMVQEGAHKYEFGDQGSILVIADDEDVTDHVHYSFDGGKSW
jgi:hypothetical protein